MAGLLDEGVEVPEEAAPAEEAQPVETDKTMTADAGPEDGPPVDAPARPEWCPENFWDEKDGLKAEAMAKSYAELRKAFNEKNNDKIGDTVESYLLEDYFTAEGNFKADGLVVPKDDPMLQAAYNAAKDAGLGVKATNEFISKFMGQAAEFAPPAIDVQAEIAKLGKNANHVIAGIKTWIDGLETKGAIDSEVKAKMVELGSTAAGIKALDVLRQKSGEMGLPTQEALTGSHNMTADDWYKAKYETHAEPGESRSAYDERMRAVGSKIFGNGYGTFNGSGLGFRR